MKNKFFVHNDDAELCNSFLYICLRYYVLRIFIEMSARKVNSQFTHEKETENHLYAVFKKP